MAGPYSPTGAFVTTTTSMDSTQKEELGILRFDGARVFRYVQATAAAIAAKSAVAHSGTSGTTVVIAPVGTNALGKGLCGIAETAFTTSGFGWITVYGPAQALVDTAAIAGVPLTNGASTAGTLQPGFNANGATTVITTGSLNRNSHIEALDTGVVTGSSVFVHCL